MWRGGASLGLFRSFRLVCGYKRKGGRGLTKNLNKILRRNDIPINHKENLIRIPSPPSPRHRFQVPPLLAGFIRRARVKRRAAIRPEDADFGVEGYEVVVDKEDERGVEGVFCCVSGV